MQEYRGYFFGNMYMNSISQGIQAAHVVSTMALAIETECFIDAPEAKAAFYEWAKSPTKILLNGGDSDRMYQYKDLLTKFGKALHLPYAWFREPGMENCMSSIGIVVPDYIYKIKHVDTIRMLELNPDDYADLDLTDILAYDMKSSTDAMYLLAMTLKSAKLAL